MNIPSVRRAGHVDESVTVLANESIAFAFQLGGTEDTTAPPADNLTILLAGGGTGPGDWAVLSSADQSSPGITLTGVGGITVNAATLNTGASMRPVPYPAALAPYMGVDDFCLDSRANLEADLQDAEKMRYFQCPSAANIQVSQTLRDPTWVAPLSLTAYAFNEAPMGWWPPYPRVAGVIAKIGSPATTILFADGQARTEFAQSFAAWYAYTNDRTLLHAPQTVNAGSPSVFDYVRHDNRMAGVYVDGHAEVFAIAGRGLPDQRQRPAVTDRRGRARKGDILLFDRRRGAKGGVLSWQERRERRRGGCAGPTPKGECRMWEFSVSDLTCVRDALG